VCVDLSGKLCYEGENELKKIVVVGGLNIDYVAKVDRLPSAGESVPAEEDGPFQGGKGANQAVAIAKLGGDVTMLGTIGSDSNGDYLISGLSENGVNKEYINVVDSIKTEKTGKAWIAVSQLDGNNEILTFRGANRCTDIKYIESVRSVIESADIVLMQLEIPLETVCYVASMAKGLGKLVILDPSPLVGCFPDTLLSNIDYIKPNETELYEMIGCSANYREGTLQLIKRGAKNVIVSLGDKGVYCCTNNGVEIEKPALEVDAIDVTAAGDGFLAAFVLSLAEGKTVEKSIDFGQNVAAYVVTKRGAQVSLPTASEIAKWKEHYNHKSSNI